MDRPPILFGFAQDPTAFQTSAHHCHHVSTHHHKRPRSLSPVDDRTVKRRQNYNGVSQPTTPMLLSVLGESHPKFRMDSPPNIGHELCFEPPSACHEVEQDVKMDCEDQPPMIIPDPRWPIRSLRRVTPPTNNQTAPVSPPSTHRPQPLHRPHPAAYQQHLALLCPTTETSIRSPSSPSSTSNQPLPEKASKPKNSINYMLGPKKGCEDCRKKVAGHYTHL
ncbi:hypothetical protein CROQUDRAFT_650367 [Cronartium quercuum f. sp. fusiforme G11]|uniref:Uncharacterized protein n=1 Tax=Cronartium quercuum f. sp. fusiforme G11 TaxID=708437 RepID=A0A9P6NU32_9BASI|nr:hypothetical protein CROQUDRAFT_650367 [Cronartium quercuum f. sp. fusiforme G11]